MQEPPDSTKVVQRVIELLGGREKWQAVVAQELEEKNRRWNQNTDLIGRILRAHLYVEHYLTEHLQKSHSKLGDVTKARLSYSQKVALLDAKDFQLADALAGIKHLNAIRNRLAHNLNVSVTGDDLKVFLGAVFFKSLREELAKQSAVSPDPIAVLESFAQYAASVLGHKFSLLGKAFDRAIAENLMIKGSSDQSA